MREQAEYVRALEQNGNTLLASFADAVPDALDKLEPEKLLQLYRMLMLRLTASEEGSLELNGVFGNNPSVCTSETTSAGCTRGTRGWDLPR